MAPVERGKHEPSASFDLNATARSNGIDIKVLRHHTVSVSNFKVSTDDSMVNFQQYSWIPRLIHPFNFLQSELNKKL